MAGNARPTQALRLCGEFIFLAEARRAQRKTVICKKFSYAGIGNRLTLLIEKPVI
jgi:hypothetical protein